MSACHASDILMRRKISLFVTLSSLSSYFVSTQTSRHHHMLLCTCGSVGVNKLRSLSLLYNKLSSSRHWDIRSFTLDILQGNSVIRSGSLGYGCASYFVAAV